MARITTIDQICERAFRNESCQMKMATWVIPKRLQLKSDIEKYLEFIKSEEQQKEALRSSRVENY